MSVRPTRIPPPLVIEGTAADGVYGEITDINDFDVVGLMIVNRELSTGAPLLFRWGDTDDPTTILPDADDRQDAFYAEDIPAGYAIRVTADKPLKLAGSGGTANYTLRVFYLSPPS